MLLQGALLLCVTHLQLVLRLVLTIKYPSVTDRVTYLAISSAIRHLMRASSKKHSQTGIPMQTKAAERATVASSPQLEVRRGGSVSLAMSSEAWMQRALTTKPDAQTGHSLTVTCQPACQCCPLPEPQAATQVEDASALMATLVSLL